MIRCIIADDDPFIRESLKLILPLSGELEVVALCANGEEAVEAMRHNDSVDIVLMDIRMPVCDGVESTLRIKAEFPGVAVLILTTFDEDDYLIQAISGGANGYMLKNSPPEQIMDGIRNVCKNGHLLIHPQMAEKLAHQLKTRSLPRPSSSEDNLQEHRLRAKAKTSGLTETEQQVWMKVADGLSNREIAAALYLSEGTVKNYVSSILDKLMLRDRTQLAISYYRGTDDD